MTGDQLEGYRNKPWTRVFKKEIKTTDSLESVYPTILNELSTGIIVKESRWTWVKEQKERLRYSHAILGNKEP